MDKPLYVIRDKEGEIVRAVRGEKQARKSVKLYNHGDENAGYHYKQITEEQALNANRFMRDHQINIWREDPWE